MIDKSQFRAFSSFAEADEADRKYWLKPLAERREALKLMHQVIDGEDFELADDISDDRVLEILLTS